MTDPTENIPSDRHPGQSDRSFEFGTLGLFVSLAGDVGTVVEFADQFDGSFEGMEVPVSVVADVHQTPAEGAIPIENVEFQEGEIGILGPVVRHPAVLNVLGRLQ